MAVRRNADVASGRREEGKARIFAGAEVAGAAVELVAEAVALCESVGRPVATPNEAAAILALPRA